METLVAIIVFAYIGYVLYRSGKRNGSRKGYHVGKTRSGSGYNRRKRK